jgi:hypothetical protein
MVRFPANVVKSNGGELVGGIGERVDGERFAAPPRGCPRTVDFALFPIAEDPDYDDMSAAGREFTAFLRSKAPPTR